MKLSFTSTNQYKYKLFLFRILLKLFLLLIILLSKELNAQQLLRWDQKISMQSVGAIPEQLEVDRLTGRVFVRGYFVTYTNDFYSYVNVYDSSGILLYALTAPDTFPINDIDIDSGGNLLLLRTLFSFGVVIEKYAGASGQLLWQNQIGTGGGGKVQCTGSSLTGFSFPYSLSDSVRILMGMIDSTGNLLWTSTYGEPVDTWGYAAINSSLGFSDGSFLFAGTYQAGDNYYTNRGFVIRCTPSGQTQMWLNSSEFMIIGNSKQADGYEETGKYYWSAIRMDTINFIEGPYILTMDSGGGNLSSFPSPFENSIISSVDSAGRFIISGYDYNWNLTVGKFDSLGDMDWGRTIDTNMYVRYAEDISNNGNLILSYCKANGCLASMIVDQQGNVQNFGCYNDNGLAVNEIIPIELFYDRNGYYEIIKICRNQYCTQYQNITSVLRYDFLATGIDATQPENVIQWGVSPNPANSSCAIYLNGERGWMFGDSWSLMSIEGRILGQGELRPGDKMKTIELSSMPSGIYVVRIVHQQIPSVRKLLVCK